MRSGVYETPLDIAWNNGFIEVAEELFERLVKPEYRGPEVHKALCMAAESRNGARVNALLGNGAYVNYQDDSYGPALVYAVRGGNIEIANTLLKHGAMVNVESSIYGCPLEAAVQNKSHEMVNFLLENNADVNFSGTGNSLLSAAIEGDLNMARLLINKGADVGIEVSEYGTPIFAAAIYGHKNVASYLLEKGQRATGEMEPEYHANQKSE
ncbi:hypothetical protein N7471_010544 [Penicillium samsonianum]|uniref:uncharacterized protein n=1 Tax=Penicillium samsonianum TaxID=1882272 RepID=UPI002548B304|nr:uncharacterized protein N7471_010544 [Penicillium samsonianum]KAJ6126051.1 hypothetical protein N7471_010544 [Penicillium samsonianum]